MVQVCIFSMDRLERPRVSAPLPRISSPRPRASSPLGRSRTLRKVADRSNARPSKKFQLSGRFRRALILGPLLCIAAIYPLMWFLSVPPLSFARTTSSCLDEGTDYQISEHYLCTNACGKVCFPRVHGMCISRTQVTICDDLPYFSKDIIKAGGGLPDTLRLITNVPRDRVRVKRGTCPGWDSRLHEPVDASGGERTQGHWIRGLQMVADVKLMPHGKKVGPNPHHEAEKLIPAVLLSHLYGLRNSTLYWFAHRDPKTISRWSLGLIKVFLETMKVEFMDVPGPDEPQICFEDAILFSGLTNAGYVPGREANAWLREKVLGFCNIPVLDASRPVNNVVIVERIHSSRSIANMDEVKYTLEKELMVVPKVVTSGVGDFCDQVKVIASADFAVTPHGSHNINFLFARRYSTVLEAFPLLYYIDWFGNYVHAANVNHHELYGTWLAKQGSLPFKMRVYANLYGWSGCFYHRACMNYAKSQQVAIHIGQLEKLLKHLTSSCQVVVDETCLFKNGSWKNSVNNVNDFDRLPRLRKFLERVLVRSTQGRVTRKRI